MKFKREFQDHLENDGFPLHWVESAISYGRLKKCIKRIEEELATLGLDPTMVQTLLRAADEEEHGTPKIAPQEKSDIAALDEHGGGSSSEVHEPTFQYGFETSANLSPFILPNGQNGRFVPKLQFAIDEATGEPVDARLSDETRSYLHNLAVQKGMILPKAAIDDDPLPLSEAFADMALLDEQYRQEQQASNGPQSTQRRPSKSLRLVEVPLTADGEFFVTLQREVSGLVNLQAAEQKHLGAQIDALRHLIAELTTKQDNKTQHDLDQWRKIFDVYLAHRIFFATTERDHGARDSATARRNWEQFQSEIKGVKFKRKESAVALQKFTEINLELLQSLQFQELNNVAITKIVKKFDKRTGFGIKTTLPNFLPQVLSADFARDLSAQVSSQIASVIPSLDDYLCPVCFEVAYRPVRLGCEHVFCIRCLITMQADGKDRCPLCREEVVMGADSANLDLELAEFLRKTFPAEVKAKQKQNEQAVARDHFGAAYDQKCHVM